MRRWLLLLVVLLVGCNTATQSGAVLTTATPTTSAYVAFLSTADGELLVSNIRDAEALVIGDVFTDLMNDSALVSLTLVLCAIGDSTDDSVPLVDAREVLSRFDWNMPANAAMAEHIFATGRATACSAGLSPPDLPLDAVIPPRPQGGSIGEVGDIDSLMAEFLATEDGQRFIEVIRQSERNSSPVFTETMTDLDLVRLARGICSTEAELGADASTELRLYQQSRGWTQPSDEAMFGLLSGASVLVCSTVGS